MASVTDRPLAMPTTEEFLAFYRRKKIDVIDDDCFYSESVMKRWLTEAHRKAYSSWASEERKRRANTRHVTFEKLVEMIDTTNYSSQDDLNKLGNALVEGDLVPWIPAGSRNGIFYRIAPGFETHLQADQLETEGDLEYMSHEILGVNTNVQPEDPPYSRRANLPEKSTKSNVSDFSENGGFVFYQIGRLESTTGGNLNWTDGGRGYRPDRYIDYINDENADLKHRYDWRETGFCVVVRLERTGAANGIYIIFDFYPKDPMGDGGDSSDPDDDNWYTGRTDDDEWGNLRGSHHPQFSMAKIADRITDLRYEDRFTLTEVVNYPIEIVGTAKNPEGAIFRLFTAQTDTPPSVL